MKSTLKSIEVETQFVSSHPELFIQIVEELLFIRVHCCF